MTTAPEPSSAGRTEVAAHGLKRKILKETSLFAVLEVVSALLGFCANIGLARLLERRDFGLFGICSFYVGLGTLLGNGGLGATLLRRKGDVTDEEYRVTLTALLAVASVFALALIAGAPWIAAVNQFSDGERLLIQAMAPLYLVNALRVVPYVRLERRLLFSAIARIELYAGLCKHVFALAVAILFGSVWALVVSQVMGSLVQLVLAYRAAPGWVGLGFSWPVFRPLISYGVKVQGLAISAYLKDNVSRALLGAWAGPVAVGLFDFGMSYIQVPVQAVNGLARVQLPVYARLEARDPVLYSTLRGAMRTALLLGLPLLGMLALGAPWLIPFIYGSKWAPSYPVVWGLLLNMACGLIASPLFTLAQGQGRAGMALVVFALWTSFTWLLSIVVLVFALGGIGVVAAAISVATLAVTVFLLVWASRHLGQNALSGLGGPILGCCGALGVAFALPLLAPPGYGHPLLQVVLFAASYVVIVWLLEGKLVVAEVRGIVADLRSKS